MPYIVTNEGLVIGGANPASQVPSPIFATRPLVVQPTGINPSPIITSPIISQKTKIQAVTNGVDPSGKGGIPEKLLSMNVVETPVSQQTYTNSAVFVAFTRDTSDVNYDHVAVWFVGYHGSSTPTLMASGTTSPVSFLCDTTGETVTVIAQTISSTGLSAPLAFALTSTVTLNGVISAPPAPTVNQGLVGTPTGYQFAFNQVVLPAGDEEVIYCYNIYRSATANTFASASLLTTIISTPSLSGAITYSDTVNTATANGYYYFVTAVNTAGYESTATAMQSGLVQGSVGSMPPSISTPFKVTVTSTSVTITSSPSCFFTRADGTQVVIGSTSMACTGLPTSNEVFFYPYWRESDQTLQWVKAADCNIPNITGISCVAASHQYVETTNVAAIPVDFTVELWFKGATAGALADYSEPTTVGTGTSVTMQLQVTSAGEIEFSLKSTSAWISVTTAGASVLDGSWHHLIVSYNHTTTTGMVFVDGANTSDNVTFWTNTGMGPAQTNNGYWHIGVCQGITGAPLTGNTYNGFLLSHAAVYSTPLTSIQAAAHMNAFVNLGESYWMAETTYDSAVSVWKLTETSGTTAADSAGSNTGTYENTPTLNQTSAIVTILGSPADAFPFAYLGALQQQNLRNHTPLSNGPISGDTGTTGTQAGGGSGGGTGGKGGGGGYCFTGNTLIDTQLGPVAIQDITVFDQCKTAKGNWLYVAKLVKHEAERLCLHVMPHGELVTFAHKILRGSEWVNAGLVFPETREVNEPVYTIEMESTEPMSEVFSPVTERSFTLSSGVIAHNNVIGK